MGFLERAIRRGVSEGIGKAVGDAISKAIEPTATEFANKAAEHFDSYKTGLRHGANFALDAFGTDN